jgi:hypothetical protein
MNTTTKVADYLRHAAECRSLAATAATVERRRVMLDLADRWLALAEEREMLARDHPDLFTDEDIG